MYYPYFRGKQFDLLALKSLLEMEQLSLEVQPVIEPIRQSKTFWDTVELFQKKAHPFFVIVNPQAGDFLTEEGSRLLQTLPNAKAYIIDQPIETIDCQPDLWVVHGSAPALASDWSKNRTPILVGQEFRLLKKIQGPKILMHDFFTRLPRTASIRKYQKKCYQPFISTTSSKDFPAIVIFLSTAKSIMHIVIPLKQLFYTGYLLISSRSCESLILFRTNH